MKIILKLSIALSCLVFLSASKTSEKWKLFSNNLKVRSIIFDWQNNLYAISANDEAFSYSLRTQKWTPILPGKKVKTMDIYPDGTIMALDKKDSLMYKRTNGVWSTTNGMAAQALISKEGKQFFLLQDGSLIVDGKKQTGTFSYMCNAMMAGRIYLVGTDNKIYIVDKGKSQPGEVVGGGLGKCVAGTGTGVLKETFIIGNGYDSNVYYFDANSQKNLWTKLESNQFMKFIAMNPSGKLYGIGADDNIYLLMSIL